MASSAPRKPGAGAANTARLPSRPTFNPGWGLVVLGGLLGVLGAFLTWATVDYGGVATHTYRGVSAGRDGKITVVLAVLVLGLTAAAFLGWVSGLLRPALTIVGLVMAFVALADLVASPSVGSEEEARLRTAAHVTSSNGIGEWLTLVAGILVVIGVVLVGRYSRPRSSGAHAAAAIGESVRVGSPTPGPSLTEQAPTEPALTGPASHTPAAVEPAEPAEPAAETPSTDEASAATPAEEASVTSSAAEVPTTAESKSDAG